MEAIAAVLGLVLGYGIPMLSKVALQPEIRREKDLLAAFIADELKLMQGLLAAAYNKEGDGNKIGMVRLKQVRDLCIEIEDYLQYIAVQREENFTLRTLERVKALRMKVEIVSKRRFGSNTKPTAPAAAAALPYVAYDEYVLHGDCGAAHADDGITVEQYKEIYQMVVEYDMFSEENGVLVLPGETDDSVVYRIASEHSKKVIRTMLKSLRANVLGSLCFGPFAESNLVVSSSGKVKFRKVSVLRNLTGHDLLQHQKKNYLSAHTIIEDLFSGNPPEDIQHLLRLIKNSFEKGELFHIHGSLLPMAMYSDIFKDIYDHSLFVLPSKDLRVILGSLPYVDTWKTQIDTNDLLQIPFKRNPKSYKVPLDNQGQTCLNNDQKSALIHLGLTPQPKQRSLTPAQIQLIGALQFVVYLRNRSSHRMEPLKKWTEANQAYNAQGSELVSYVRFPMIVPHMQLQLYNWKMYHEIPMGKFF